MRRSMMQKELEYLSQYVWWQDPKELIKSNPIRIIAAAMRYANDPKSMSVLRSLPEHLLTKAISQAQPGWFDKKSWSYWHYILDIVSISSPVPPLPKRGFMP
jgi:hypothetical protein